jgi:MGT family glycosyltransferase
MKILFTPYGGGSIAHIVRSLSIADVLRDRGHEILFTAPTTKKKFIESAGYPVFGDGHPEVNLNDEVDQSIRYFQANRDLFLAWLGDEITAAEQFRPDIIVNSPTFFGALAGIKLGIPQIAIVNSQWITEFKGLLGLSASTDSPRHKVMRMLAKPIFANQFERIYMQEIRSFYASLGVDPAPHRRRDLHGTIPLLIPGIPEFEPINAGKRQNAHYVGPLFWNGFERHDFLPTTIWSDFGEKPFVYASLGGSIYRKQSYIDLVEALNTRPDWHIVLSLGPNITSNELPRAGGHISIRPYVGGLAVCSYADAVMTTGGHGTVMQALWHGKPLVALPHNIDQATIAARLEELGVGTNLNPVSVQSFSNREQYFRQATSIAWSKVIQATEHVLKDDGMRRNAVQLKGMLRVYDHADRLAADLITKYGVPSLVRHTLFEQEDTLSEST